MTAVIVQDEHLHSAIDRIARTAYGQTLYLFLQKTLSSFPSAAASADALLAHNGRRMFAHDLMAIMAAGIRETHGGRDPTDGPIVFNPREPARIAGRERPRDHLARTDPELASIPNAGPGGGRVA